MIINNTDSSNNDNTNANNNDNNPKQPSTLQWLALIRRDEDSACSELRLDIVLLLFMCMHIKSSSTSMFRVTT